LVVGYLRRVLFLVFGSSGAGKTAVLHELRGRVDRVELHDFDEVGVPRCADIAWRHRANERWVQRALRLQAHGTDLLLAGQTPLGELLAAPSAPALDGVAACLLDCDDETRLARLKARGPEWLERTGAELSSYFGWAAWMRGHAADPAHQPEVIRHPASDAETAWSRWSNWRAGDPRWRVRVVDTSAMSVGAVADDLAAWIAADRARDPHDSGVR
jgi:hypothetical protein